jgi:hypothetical protein
MHTIEQSLNELLAKKTILWEDAKAMAGMVDYMKQ